ncbi:hypothetical protein D9M72_635420 [compost metagenome]
MREGKCLFQNQTLTINRIQFPDKTLFERRICCPAKIADHGNCRQCPTNFRCIRTGNSCTVTRHINAIGNCTAKSIRHRKPCAITLVKAKITTCQIGKLGFRSQRKTIGKCVAFNLALTLA